MDDSNIYFGARCCKYRLELALLTESWHAEEVENRKAWKLATLVKSIFVSLAKVD